MPERAVLACYAHPDDEQGVTGFLHRCVLQGVRVGIVCATRGEVGEIADPSLATPSWPTKVNGLARPVGLAVTSPNGR